jgi:hypothetical protein
MNSLNIQPKESNIQRVKQQQQSRRGSLPVEFALYNKRSEADIVSFKSKQAVINPQPQKLPWFIGKKPDRQEAENYLKEFEHYKETADLHNKLLYSYGDPSSMAQVLADATKRTGQTKDQIFDDVKNTMFGLFDKLTASPVVVVEGTKLTDFEFLGKEKYKQVKEIYNQVLERPGTFNRVKYDNQSGKVETILTSEEINHKTEDLRHIVNDILPEILKEKTLVVQDPADLHKILNDEVVQSLILDKLYAESPEDFDELINQFNTEDTKHSHSHSEDAQADDSHNHCHLGHKHSHEHKEDHESDSPDHDHEHDHQVEHHHKPPERLEKAMHVLEDIHNKFDITVLSRVPKKLYDPIGKENKDHHIPDGYYDSKYKGIRKQPRNFYEAKYLREAFKDVKGISQDNIVVVTPKQSARDVVEKVKAMNKDYLYIEDWLYKYCLGNDKDRKDIIDNLVKVSGPEARPQFEAMAKDLEKYLDSYMQVYDIKNPENNTKLNEKIKDYGKLNCMSEISRSYFLAVGEDATDLVKTLFLLAGISHVAEHAAEATGVGFLINVSNSTISCADDVMDACKNYLKWKQEFGDEEAREMLHNTIAHSLTVTLPTLALKLDASDGPLKHLMFRNASSGSTYAIVIKSFTRYYDKLEELIEKGAKKVPDEVKDDPDALAKWKFTETARLFMAHSLNRGEILGLAISQPFAVGAQPLMKLIAPIGGRPILIALAGTLECWTSNIYLLLDKHRWDKFTNKFKESLVSNKDKDITPEDFYELRKSAMTKMIESEAGQKSLSASMYVADHFPKKLANGVKKAYMGVFNVISNTVAKGVSGVSMKVLDWRYNRMTAEEREKIEGSKCCGGHGH